MSQTQQRIIPAKQMTIVTTSGLAPRMEVTVTRPAYKTPKPSREEETEQEYGKPDNRKEENERNK